MRHPALPWVLACGFALAFFATCSGYDVQTAKLDAARAAVDSLAPIVAAHEKEARTADTVLVHVTDTLTVTIERTRVVQAEAADSVRAHVDSIGAVHLDSLVAAHERHVEAVQQVADARLLWGQTWKDYAGSLEVVNAELRIANTLALAAIRAEKRKSFALSLGGGGLVVAALAVAVLR